MELETHLLIANRLAYLQQNQVEAVLELTAEVGRMLSGLTNKLKVVT